MKAVVLVHILVLCNSAMTLRRCSVPLLNVKQYRSRRVSPSFLTIGEWPHLRSEIVLQDSGETFTSHSCARAARFLSSTSTEGVIVPITIYAKKNNCSHNKIVEATQLSANMMHIFNQHNFRRSCQTNIIHIFNQTKFCCKLIGTCILRREFTQKSNPK